MNETSESDFVAALDAAGNDEDWQPGAEGSPTDPIPVSQAVMEPEPTKDSPLDEAPASDSAAVDRSGPSRPVTSWSPGGGDVQNLLESLVGLEGQGKAGEEESDSAPAIGSPQLVRSIPPTATETYGGTSGTTRRTSILQQTSASPPHSDHGGGLTGAAAGEGGEKGKDKWGDGGPPPDFEDAADDDDSDEGTGDPRDHVELLQHIDATWSKLAGASGPEGDAVGPSKAPQDAGRDGASRAAQPNVLDSQELSSFLAELNSKYQTLISESSPAPPEPPRASTGDQHHPEAEPRHGEERGETRGMEETGGGTGGAWEEETGAALRQLKLRPLPPKPSEQDLRAALTAALREAKHGSARAAEATHGAAEARRRDADILAGADRREAELRAAKKAAQEAANAAEAEAERCRDAELTAAARARRTEAECKGLRRQLTSAEASGRQREKEAERLKAALAAKVDREEARAGRHRDAYARLKQSAAGGGGRAVRDLRPAEVAGIYEEQLEAAKAEAKQAKAEVARMAEEVRRSMNSLREGQEMAARATRAEDRVAALEAELRAAARQAAEGASADRGSDEAALLEDSCRALQEENAALKEELLGRPSAGELQEARQQVEILEDALAAARAGSRRSAAGEEGDSAGAAARRLGLNDRERMARDRLIHRLGLRCAEDLPRAALVAALQDACVALELRDPEQLPGALRKLVRVVAAVPKMEAFVSGCCEAVFRRGCAFLPPGTSAGGGAAPQQVPRVLEHWIAQLGRLAELEEMRGSVAGHLALRVAARGDPKPSRDLSSSELIYAVKRLVEREQAALRAADTIAAAEEMMQDPAGLLEKIVLRFQDLFECPKLEDVMTTINQVFMIMEESRNFRRNLVALLGLDNGSSSAVCIASVRRLLDHNGAHMDLQDDYVSRLEADQERNRARRQADEFLRRATATPPSDPSRRRSPPGGHRSPYLAAFSASSPPPVPMRT